MWAARQIARKYPPKRRLRFPNSVLSWAKTAVNPPAAAAQPAGVWEAEIAEFEARDRLSPPPSGQIVFAGSSSIRLWDVEKYFPGLTIINRGFGGSQLSDLVRYADRIVIAYKPRIVVVYAGDNDIYGGATSEQVAIRFEQFVRAVRAALPEGARPQCTDKPKN